jgi:hypothetical protein
MPVRQTATLTVYSEGGLPLYQVRDFLGALDYAYNYLYLALMFLDDPERGRRVLQPLPTDNPRRYGRLVPREDRLIFKGAEIHSPGSWVFEGIAGVLEQIRLGVNDWHERRKDREYREPAERQELELNNQLKQAELGSKQMKLLRRKIAAAKEMGATDEELHIIWEQFIHAPLAGLNHYQDQKLISGASEEPGSGEDGAEEKTKTRKQ